MTASGQSDIRPALGLLIPEFPNQTHAFFWREAKAIEAAGVRVEFFSTRRPAPGASRHPFADEAAARTTYLMPPTPRDAVSAAAPRRVAATFGYVASLRQSPRRALLRVSAMALPAARLADAARRLGVVHVHVHSFADALHVAALAERFGGPSYSATLHGDLEVYGKDHAVKLARCSAVATAGNHLVDPVAALGFPRDRVKSNVMGVDTSLFTPSPRDPDGVLRVITVARLHVNKGHRFALEALARLLAGGTDCRYTVVGSGPHADAVARDVSRLGLGDRVDLAGSCGETHVLDLLRRHDVFLLPSVRHGEASPVSLMEAMSCGLASVVSDIGSTPAMVDAGRAGILCPQGDVDAIEAALRRLRDPAARDALGHAARRFAVAHFDFKSTSLGLYDHLRRFVPTLPPPHRG